MKEKIASKFDQQVASASAWLHPLKTKAMARFSALGFPSLKHEEWKYTNVEPLTHLPFEYSTTSLIDAIPNTLKEVSARLVFVNGNFSEKHSSIKDLPKGLTCGPLSKFLQEKSSIVEAHLSKHVTFEDHAFVALNTAFVQEGAFIHIAAHAIVEKPIEVIYISNLAQSFVAQPRNLIVAEAQSQASIVERYVGQDSVYLMNSVTEISAADSAVVEHVKLQEESEKAYHLFSLGIHQGRQSRVSTHSISLGASLARNDLTSILDAEGAECIMNGLYLTSGKQHVDHHTTLDHAKPHCSSQELYKGILGGSSRGVFNGKVIVRPHAIKTNSAQSNKNLLVSDNAEIDTKPLLEIFNNDVKCSHGATTGRLDPKQIFYLRSRGIGEDYARSLLSYAFAGEVIDKIQVAPLRERLQGLLFDRLMLDAQRSLQ